MDDKKGSYIIETVRVGEQVKVTACDPETGTEASVIVPATATRKEMSTLAGRKLEYVLRKNQGSAEPLGEE